MYKIENKITLVRSSLISKSLFTNEAINNGVCIDFECCNCGKNNEVNIIPYKTGFSLIPLYSEDIPLLSKTNLLETKVVSKTSSWMSHFGELTIEDLPTLYFGTNCSHCQDTYICFFSYGEKQPGLTLLKISGIVEFKYTN